MSRHGRNLGGVEEKRRRFVAFDVSGLSGDDVYLLYDDVVVVWSDAVDGKLLSGEVWQHGGWDEAERLLHRRIGGQSNLAAYLDCLRVGRRKREF